MSTAKTKMNRRSFLKVSMWGSAGLMIGFSWMSSFIGDEKTMDVPDEWYDINAYIKIAGDGEVTIFSPNPEIGQNVKTSMPLIVAEELDADWDKVKVEQAPLDTNKYTRQLAGGSQSIRQSWDSLRMAGATARYLLVAAAAKKWNTNAGNLSTDKGIITNKKTGETLGYGEVATAAASVPVPDEVELKDPRDFKLIGSYIKNVDGKEIVTGKPLFGLDYRPEGTPIAMIVHPPAFGMKFKSFDASEAKSMPGIYDVFTIDTSIKNPQWSDVNAFNELAVVTGKTTWQVMKAKKALNIEWEQTGELESTEMHEERMKDALKNRSGKVERQDGNPGKMRNQAAKVIERVYTAPFLAHNTMEPMNYFADVKDNSAELVGPVQTPEPMRSSVAALLGMPESNITVKMTRMGGGFGRRLYGNFGLEAAAISRKIGGPVKLVYMREDDMTQGTYRPAYAIRYRGALDENGKLLSFEAKGTGVPSSPLFANRYPAGTLDHYKSENVNVKTDITTGAWRAPRSNFVAGAEQSFIDELAYEAGKDPIDFRLELFDRAITDPVGKNNDYDPKRYAGVLKLVREKSNWGQKTPGVYRGVTAYYCHNSYVAQVADVVMENGSPKVQKVWCAVDCGIVVNKEGAINQIEGAIIDGMGHSMYSHLTFKDGKPQQNNFDQYHLIRNSEVPEDIEVFFVENEIHPTGLGEPALPPVSGAIANAVFQATGKRWYNQPFTVANQEMRVG